MAGHECNAPFQVEVDGVGVPIVGKGAQLVERKDGPVSVTRRAEVHIPIEAFGETWTDYITLFDDGETQVATVYIRPIDLNGNPSGERRAYFRGYTARVGSSNGTNLARFSIFDPAKFLNQVDAGITFGGRTTTLNEVLRYVKDKLIDEVPIINSLSVRQETAEDRLVRGAVSGDASASPILLFPTPPQRFSANRDTLADVVEWAMRVSNSRIEFRATENGSGFEMVVNDSIRSSYDVTGRPDSPPFLIENDALYEMRPFNGIKVKGQDGTKIQAPIIGSDLFTLSGKNYYEATATYPPLVERFGGELIRTETSNTTEQSALKNEAVSLLKESLDEVSGGTMRLTLSPMVRPFDTITATPACAGVTSDGTPIEYEVERAVHSITPEDQTIASTDIGVSLSVDKSEIDVTSTKRNTQPDQPISGGGSNSEYDNQ